VENISLHILDIAENSIRAQARKIRISIQDDQAAGLLTIEIEDDGQGMDEKMLHRAVDPFTTTRSTRKVGLGLPLLAESARQSGGDLTIRSSPGQGTLVKVVFHHSSIDMKPLGDMINTLMTLVIGSPHIDFLYSHSKGDQNFSLDTAELKNQLEGTPLHDPDVIMMIRQYLQEGFEELGVSFY